MSDVGFRRFDYLPDAPIATIHERREKWRLQAFIAVEAAGIEPASADAPERASTSVVPDSDSPAGRFRDDTPDGLAIL